VWGVKIEILFLYLEKWTTERKTRCEKLGEITSASADRVGEECSENIIYNAPKDAAQGAFKGMAERGGIEGFYVTEENGVELPSFPEVKKSSPKTLKTKRAQEGNPDRE